MVRRLVRRERQAKAEGLRQQELGTALRGSHAPPGGSKKSTGGETIGQLIAAWQQGRPASDQTNLSAKIPPTWHNLTPRELTEHAVAKLVNEWKSRLAANSVLLYRCNLRLFLKFLDRAYHTDLAAHIPKVMTPQPRTRTITDTDFAALMFLAQPWFKCFLLLCRNLGLRLNEATNLRPSDYNPETQRLSFHRKAEGSSNLPVSGELARYIQTATRLNPDTTILTSLAGKRKPICQRTIYLTWRRLTVRAGVSRDIHIHDLRRTIAARVHELTGDIRVVQQLLGHRNLASTLGYLGTPNPEKLRQAIAAAAPVNILDSLPLPTEVKQ